MIAKEKFEAYVEVQMSGVTNMFNVPMVTFLSGLTKEECLNIMKNYVKHRGQFKEEVKINAKD